MAVIEWTGKRTNDPEATGDVYVQMKVDGKSHSARFTAEAIEDFGEAACMEKAEEMVRKLSSAGTALPPMIPVRTTDFA